MFSTYSRLDVHVWASDLHVLRQARLRLDARFRRGTELRDQRRRFYRQMLAHHHDQQALCRQFAL